MSINKKPCLITPSSHSRRQFLKSTAAVTVVGLSAAAATMPSPAKAAPKRGGNLRFGIGAGATTDTLDPGTWTNSFNLALGFGVHGYMTQIEADGSLVGNVAESWEGLNGATVWRFKIRDGITFHSGRTVVPADVVASINYHRGEDSTSAAKPLLAAITDIAVDGQVVVVTLDSGNADFPVVLSDYHIPICPADGESIDWRSGDGCGPYKIDSLSQGVSATFSRNENDWTDERGFFDTIEMIVLLDQNARTSALVSGDVDAIDRIDLKTAGLLGRNTGIEIKRTDGTQHYTFPMNASIDPYANNHVRLAMKYALNREELVEKILFGYGSVGNDHPIGRGQKFFNTELEQRTYDPDKAKFHLKQAGLDSLDVMLHASDGAYAGAVDASILFQNSAKAANINIEVVREPADGYWSDVWMVKPLLASFWGGRPVEDQMFSTAYQTGVPWNETFWSNERFDEVLVAARAELDEDKRREMYFELQEIVNLDGGIMIPMFASYVFAASDKVAHGDLASNWDVDGERWMERWWFA